MVDSDLGLTLVFNGCIYNYQELRAELEAAGYRFFSTADSEVVIKAFHHWGVRCVDRFKGMFAFAIAERDTGVVTLARDRLGIKPLYLASLARPAAIRLHGAGAAQRRRRGHRTGPPGPAPLHDLPLRGARTADDLPRRAQAATGNRAGDPARRIAHRHRLLDTGIPPRPGQSVLVGRRLGSRADGCAAYRRDAPDGRRRARRRVAVGRHRLLARGGAAGRAGPARPGHLQHRISTRPAANPATSTPTPT